MNEQGICKCVAALRHFRTRSEAIRTLVEAGDAAVKPLLDALDEETQEGARWAILRCLAELRAAGAVAHIAPLLQDAHYRTAAHETLVKITGEDLGPSVEPWLRWSREGGASASSAAPARAEMHMTGLPDARLMELAVENCNAAFHQETEGRYTVEVKLAGGEMQDVDVNLALKDHEGAPIVVVFANCGPASPEHYEYALIRNLRMPYGAMAVRKGKSGAQFVMFNTLLREDMSPLELRKSILAIAERAALVQRELEADSGQPSEES